LHSLSNLLQNSIHHLFNLAACSSLSVTRLTVSLLSKFPRLSCLDTTAKWFIRPDLLHVLPSAIHFSLAFSCFRPQYLHSTNCTVLRYGLRLFCLSFTLYTSSLAKGESSHVSTLTPSASTRVFVTSAERHISMHLCKVNLASCKRFSESPCLVSHKQYGHGWDRRPVTITRLWEGFQSCEIWIKRITGFLVSVIEAITFVNNVCLMFEYNTDR
jgi:hypothetical protein